jgi:hypothetical protein
MIAVGIYLYVDSSTKRKENNEAKWGIARLANDFVFVWALLCLLAFYIVSVNLGSATFFAAGNIVAEAILILYVVKRAIKHSSTSTPKSANTSVMKQNQGPPMKSK